MTDAEQLLWFRLRRKQILGIPFYRQKSLGDYIVDLYAPSVGLVIEVDGSQHYDPAQMEHDEKRSAFLASLGLDTLRFTNNEVLGDIDVVVEHVWNVCRERKNPP
jgi:very-short-patch-repair endonuclease